MHGSNPQLVSQLHVWSSTPSLQEIPLTVGFACVSRSDYLPRIIEFFDRDDEAMKRLDVLRTDEVGSRLPTQFACETYRAVPHFLKRNKKPDAQDCEPGQTELCIDPAIFGTVSPHASQRQDGLISAPSMPLAFVTREPQKLGSP